VVQAYIDNAKTRRIFGIDGAVRIDHWRDSRHYKSPPKIATGNHFRGLRHQGYHDGIPPPSMIQRHPGPTQRGNGDVANILAESEIRLSLQNTETAS
jgi:hypothetical protein